MGVQQQEQEEAEKGDGGSRAVVFVNRLSSFVIFWS